MKKREDERGRLVRVFEMGDGMRRRFYDALDDSRFMYPRKNAVRHAYKWYCDGHLAKRPINGIWTCGVLAEHLLAKARASGRPSLRDAASYYAATRRAMKFILTHYKVRTRLTRPGVARARKLYSQLCIDGTAILISLGYLTPTTEI